MTDELQISVRLEDEPEIVYPDSDEDVPEVDGLQMEPAYSEVQQALIARFGSRDDVLVAGNCFIYYKNHGYPERTWLDCFVAFGVDRDGVRIPVKPITDSGVNPITESGPPDHWLERSDAGVGL